MLHALLQPVWQVHVWQSARFTSLTGKKQWHILLSQLLWGFTEWITEVCTIMWSQIILRACSWLHVFITVTIIMCFVARVYVTPPPTFPFWCCTYNFTAIVIYIKYDALIAVEALYKVQLIIYSCPLILALLSVLCQWDKAKVSKNWVLGLFLALLTLWFIHLLFNNSQFQADFFFFFFLGGGKTKGLAVTKLSYQSHAVSKHWWNLYRILLGWWWW